MKFLIVFMLSYFTVFQSLDLNTVRTNYKGATQDTIKTNNFYNDLVGVTKNDRVELVAYKGASITLKARWSKTIKEKMNGFTEGVGFVEFAVQKDSSNIEVRFVRLTIQQNSPKILKYNKNIKADKQHILNNYTSIKDASLKKEIANYISQAKGFTDEEKALILK